MLTVLLEGASDLQVNTAEVCLGLHVALLYPCLHLIFVRVCGGCTSAVSLWAVEESAVLVLQQGVVIAGPEFMLCWQQHLPDETPFARNAR